VNGEKVVFHVGRCECERIVCNMKGLCAMLKGIKCYKDLNKVNRIVKCGSIVWNIKRIVCDLDRIVCNVKLLSEMLKRSGQC
jgi:hypothetical protein